MLLTDSSLGVPHAAPVQDPEGDRWIRRRPETSDLRRKFGFGIRKWQQGQEGGSQGGIQQFTADHRRAGDVEPRGHRQRCC